MRKIKIISKKYGTHYVLVDDDDYDKVIKFKWHIAKHVCTGTFYAVRNKAVREPENPYISMSRFIVNAPLKIEVDHINLNKLDNRKANLRLANHSENGMNKNLQRNNTSGFKGVHFDKSRGNYQSYIMVNQKKIHGGRFNSKLDAAKRYNELAIKYHGKFARLNQIPT